MPPVPWAAAPPASARTSSVRCSTTGMRMAVGSVWGSAVNKPGAPVKSTTTSAFTRPAVAAARVSLSPSLISATPTVSFSLMIGTTPFSKSTMSACWALRQRRRSLRSSWVSRIWATSTSNQSKAWAQRPMRRDCPAAAAACRVGRSAGLVDRPSAVSPSAIAPDETTTTSRPSRRKAISSAAKCAKGSRAVLLRSADPILTTTRVALVSRARATCRWVSMARCSLVFRKGTRGGVSGRSRGRPASAGPWVRPWT
jgi:hypothetical protein